MPIKTLSFYKAEQDDFIEVVETALHTDVSGMLQNDSSIAVEKTDSVVFIQTFVFYPNVILAGLIRGMKVLSSDGVEYRIMHIEDFQDHQEIYLREENQ